MRILVVDDEPEVLKVIKSLLEQVGIEALGLSDSREAAKRANTDKFDGAILDSRMPHLDGFALTKIIRASPANGRAPIVMLTGANDVESMRKAFQAGVTFFLSKPITQERLTTLIRVMRGPMLKEKRRFARLPLQAAATCQAGPRQFKAECVNVSEGGVLLAASGGTSVGDEFNVEFSIPQVSPPVKARVRVVRKEPSDRVAVQFGEIDPQSRQAILDYIAGQIMS